MALRLQVQNTFLHLVDPETEAPRAAQKKFKTVPDLARRLAAGELSRQSSCEQTEDAQCSTDSPSCDESCSPCTPCTPCADLPRQPTFDEFEMPCSLHAVTLVAATAPAAPAPGTRQRETREEQETSQQQAREAPQQAASRLATDAACQTPAAMPAMQRFIAGTAHLCQPAQSSPDVSCTYLPGGAVRVQWAAGPRKFAGRSSTAVSPSIRVHVPGVGVQTLKVVALAASSGDRKGAWSFEASRGRFHICLKCESAFERADSDADETYTILLHKTDSTRLGVDLESFHGEPWWIKSIDHGLVKDWNLSHPDRQVRIHDSVLAVNDVRGDPAAIRAACAGSGAKRITLRRARGSGQMLDVSFGLGPQAAAGLAPLSPPVRHNFRLESCCRLRGGATDAAAGLDPESRKVLVVCEIAPAQGLE